MGKFNQRQGKFNANYNKKQFQGKHKKNFNKEGFKKANKPAHYAQDRPKISLREDQVGITEYINNSNPGFTAVIKSRYSDFHVNEIDLENKVLILNDLEVPKPKEEATIAGNSVSEAREHFKDIISEDDWTNIEKLAEAKDAAASLEPIEININDFDKDKRTEIHNLFKKLFSGKLISTTITKDDERYVRVAKAKGSREEKREKWTFPGEYVKFLVHKENMDTTDVASQIAKRLGLMPSKVNYCGTKDKRGITTQMFSVKRRKPSDILATMRYVRNVRIGNFSFADEVLKLGQLRGNRFRIALRHIDAAEELMVEALKKLKQNGFINYFGMQRFGNCVEVPTYEVGVALMKADYKTACELILKPREGDLPFLKNIRETWWKNRNAKLAADMFRDDRFIEKKLLDGLVKHGENDYATALRKLPRNLLLLYPHALQSLIFNKIASRRIKKYRLELLPGDLIYCSTNDESESDALQVEDVDDLPDEVDENAEIENSTKGDSPTRQKVRALTSDDVSSGNYSIYDVVLPLPGFDVQYPDNELNEWYQEELNEFGLTSESFNHNIKTFKLSGAYRKLFIQPSDLSWEFCCYEKLDAQLISSDWDQLKGNGCRDRFPIEKYANDDKLNRALILEFSLPPACYATMLLRELLKADTSSANQSTVETQAKALKQDLNSSKEVESVKNIVIETEKDNNAAVEGQLKNPCTDEATAKNQKREAESNTTAEDCDEAPLSKVSRIT